MDNNTGNQPVDGTSDYELAITIESDYPAQFPFWYIILESRKFPGVSVWR
jgi:hypothetical protein